jgi:ATP-dependent RNA helicase DHX29
MTSISTPDSKQSEAYIATVALFLIFGSSSREDKVSLRLPAAWRDLWAEFAEEKKEQADTIDRDSIRKIRDMVREKKDQELEDGVLLKGAFKGRGATRVVETGGEAVGEKGARSPMTPEAYQRIWYEKANTQSFQYMLVRNSIFYHKYIC